MTPSLIAAWWVQGLMVAVLLAAAAALLQWIARDAVPARVIWAGALLGATVLTFVAPLRLRDGAVLDDVRVVRGVPLAAAAPAAPMSFDAARFAAEIAGRVRRVLDAPTDLAAEAARAVPPVGARIALVLWALVSAVILTVLFASHRRLRGALRVAEAHEIEGIPVRLTADLGPAVVGVRAPVVAVPRWLLTLPPDAQALVVRHERSHVAAGDPLLLMSGVALAALQPWNPVAWLLVSRLRLAIELDCDRRLLRQGTSTRAYGDLLIALAAAATPARRPVVLHPMFSPHTSHLAQRIIAMTERPVRLITTRRLAVVALATVAFVAACESRLPTDAEVEAMDATMVERRVVGAPAAGATPMRYVIDGKPTTPEAAKAIPSSNIERLEIVRGEVSEMRIATRDAAALEAARTSSPLPVDRSLEGVTVVLRKDSVAAGDPPRMLVRGSRTDAFTGVLIVDGVRIERGRLEDIAPDRIESVTVIKGAQAITLYGPDGANGVIVIKTKPRE